MLMLRLQRIGRCNEPHYKIVVIEKIRGPKSQKYLDIVGSYNPKASQIIIDSEKATQWIANGVQPSDTVYNMLIDKRILKGQKKNVLPRKSPTKKKKVVEELEETSIPETKLEKETKE